MSKSKEVYFEIILPKSNYLNYRLGITKTILKGESPIDVWNKACEEAEEWHKKKHPELYIYNSVSLTVEETTQITEIELCDTINKLAVYKNNLTKNTQPYYIAQLKKITNNFSNHD